MRVSATQRKPRPWLWACWFVPYVWRNWAARISVWRNRIRSMGDGLAPKTLVISDLVAALLPARRAASVNSVEALSGVRVSRS